VRVCDACATAVRSALRHRCGPRVFPSIARGNAVRNGRESGRWTRAAFAIRARRRDAAAAPPVRAGQRQGEGENGDAIDFRIEPTEALSHGIQNPKVCKHPSRKYDGATNVFSSPPPSTSYPHKPCVFARVLDRMFGVSAVIDFPAIVCGRYDSSPVRIAEYESTKRWGNRAVRKNA